MSNDCAPEFCFSREERKKVRKQTERKNSSTCSSILYGIHFYVKHSFFVFVTVCRSLSTQLIIILNELYAYMYDGDNKK